MNISKVTEFRNNEVVSVWVRPLLVRPNLGEISHLRTDRMQRHRHRRRRHRRHRRTDQKISSCLVWASKVIFSTFHWSDTKWQKCATPASILLSVLASLSTQVLLKKILFVQIIFFRPTSNFNEICKKNTSDFFSVFVDNFFFEKSFLMHQTTIRTEMKWNEMWRKIDFLLQIFFPQIFWSKTETETDPIKSTPDGFRSNRWRHFLPKNFFKTSRLGVSASVEVCPFCLNSQIHNFSCSKSFSFSLSSRKRKWFNEHSSFSFFLFESNFEPKTIRAETSLKFFWQKVTLSKTVLKWNGVSRKKRGEERRERGREGEMKKRGAEREHCSSLLSKH